MTQLYEILTGAVIIETGVNDTLVWREHNGSTWSGDITSTIPAGTYYLDGIEASGSLLLAVQDELDADSPNAYSYSHVVQGRISGMTASVSISCVDAQYWRIMSSGTTFPLAAIGLPDADTGTTSITITNSLSPSHFWCSDQPVMVVDPGPRESRLTQRLANDGTVYTWQGSDVFDTRRLAVEHVDEARAWTAYASDESDSPRAFESWWRQVRDGRPVALYHQTISSSPLLAVLNSGDLVGTYVLDEEACASFFAERTVGGAPFFGWELGLRSYVS